MKNKVFTFGIALILGAVLCGCSTKPEVLTMKRGVNFSHWFSQTRLPDYPPVPATAEDIQLIRSLGLDHVRLPVDPVRIWEFPDEGPLNPEALQEVDAAIELALNHDLSVVVDMHPRPDLKEQLESDPATFQSFLKLWQELATHLAQYDTDRVALEILNEPMVENPENGSRWRTSCTASFEKPRQSIPSSLAAQSGRMSQHYAGWCQWVTLT